MDGLFRFEDVTVEGPERPRLADVTVELAGPGITVVAGPSGAGKSTLLRCCNRLEAPSSGRIRFHDHDLEELDPVRLRRRVAMVFQQPVPFPGTVRENLLVAARDDECDLGALLEQAALDRSLIDRDATRLSGGEAQRMCLARSLATGPEVLLLDEPTSALDPTATRTLEQTVRSLTDGDTPAVWVTQNPRQLARLADRVVVIVDGRVAHTGDVESLRKADDPAVRAVTEGAADGG